MELLVKKCVAVLVLCFLLQAVSGKQQHEALETSEEEFRRWMAEYSKVYHSDEEFRKRFTTFMSNRALVTEGNSKSLGYTLALNQFADMTHAEFTSKVLMPKRRSLTFSSDKYAKPVVLNNSSLPASFDWREKGVVTPVRNQGSAGTCWAFSAVENIESQWAIAGHNLTALSVEQLVDCDNTQDSTYSYRADCGVFGGWPYLAYQYIKRIGGIQTEKDYPYCSGLGKCYPCPTKNYNKTRCGPPVSYCNKTDSCDAKLNTSRFVPGLKVVDWVAINGIETEMESQLVKRGPLSILINAEFLQFYHSGVWSPPEILCGNGTDHAVLLVGYGTEKGLFGDKPYWLVKNSWGTKWGMDGYFKLERGKGICGVGTGVTSAILSP
jgi:cathepsin F